MSDFQLKFQAQIDYLQQKINLPTESYKDLTARQHDRAFVVAGAMKADLLNDLHVAVNEAVASGQTLKDFQKNFDQIIAKRGWLADSDKEYKAWRAKIIYQTNLRTSHAAGRYKQMTDPDVLKRRPYWVYRHNSIENPRITHESWNNLVLPAEHAFWKVNFPPNGYGCNCTVEAINERQMNAMGKTKPDQAPSLDDDRTEFDSAPGAAWYPDLNQYPAPLAKSFVAEHMNNGVFDRFIEHTFDNVDEIVTAAQSVQNSTARDKLIKQQLKKISTSEQYPIAVLTLEQQQLLGLKTQTVLFKQSDAVQQVAMSTAGISRDLQHMFDRANWVVRTGRNKLLLFVRMDRRNFLAELQQTPDGLFLKSFNTASASDIAAAKRSGTLLIGG